MGINYQQRRDRLRKKFRKAGIDSLLVTNYTNVTYLTGFTGDDSYLLVRADGDLLISDSRFAVQLKEECPDLDVKIRPRTEGIVQASVKAIGSTKALTLGVESTAMTVIVFQRLERGLPKATIAPVTGLVESLREIKDKYEIQSIRRAVRQAERAIQSVTAGLVPGQTELEVAADIEHTIRRFGGRKCSFPPIVAVGPRAALPHATPTERTIGESDFVLIDWGARETQYVSDLTRIFVTGKISPKLERIYGIVLEAQQRAIRKIKPGVSMGDVDFAARSFIDQAGFGKQFGHGLGHGIGLDVHEAPRIVDKQKHLLKAGMVITIEPGIYLPGWGGAVSRMIFWSHATATRFSVLCRKSWKIRFLV